mgnify:CR=1 FL=1
MTMLRQYPFEGDTPTIVGPDNPLAVSVVNDVQTQDVRVNGTNPQQVVVSTSVVTLIVPYNANRRSVLLTNLTGSQICHLGLSGAGQPTLSATTSRAILTGAVGSNVTFYAKDAIYGLSATSAQTVLVWEEEYNN